MAVSGGKDIGSFRDRFLDYPDLHESIISKTGTLKHTSSLAGILLINGDIPFAILNHTTNSAGARKFQDRFVSKMFDHLGVPTPLDYTKISIFPWDDSDFLITSR
jgi:D-alanyl-D-alanine carboxypeptidase